VRDFQGIFIALEFENISIKIIDLNFEFISFLKDFIFLLTNEIHFVDFVCLPCLSI